MALRVLQIDLLIDAGIVEIIIGDMRFHPDDIDGIAHPSDFSFMPKLDDSEEDASTGDISW